MNTIQETKRWRRRILWTTWITYAGFYLARTNMSIALPGIMAEYGISKTVMGGVLTSLFALYATGQFINGQLGDKFGSRRLVAIGISGSVLLNVAFGFSNGILAAMMVIWGLNGYFQAMGWGPSVKIVANWFPRKERGKASGILGTSYQIGNAASWLLSGLVIGQLGWRWGFWIPGILFGLLGIHWLVRARNAPEEVGLPTIEHEGARETGSTIEKDHFLGFGYTLTQTIMNPKIWIVGFGLFFLNIVRYGFLSWAPTYMFETQEATITVAAFKAMAFPLAGSLGALSAGWISDKFFGSRRAPLAAIMLLLLAGSVGLYPHTSNWMLSLACLMMIGFLTFGPHMMMVTAMPMELGTRKAASSATGFIDGMGYIGAAITGIGTGWLLDNFSWNVAFYSWLAAAVVAGGLMLLLWNYKPGRTQYY